MRNSYLLLATIGLLAACTPTSVQDEAQSKQELSWEEKTIVEIMKSGGWSEKNLDLSMEQLIDKKETCYDYAYNLYGKEAEIVGNNVFRHEHRYSPRFDRCFTKRHISRTNEAGLMAPQILFFDVISETVFFGKNDDCESQIVENIAKSGLSQNEYREHFRCPSDGDVMMLWDALTDTSS